MDPVSLASTVVAILAAKSAEEVGTEGGKAAWDGFARLLTTIKARFRHDSAASMALTRVEETSSDESTLQELATAIRAQAEADEQFRSELLAIVEEARASRAVRGIVLQSVQGSHLIQAVFNAPVHGDVVIRQDTPPDGDMRPKAVALGTDDVSISRRLLFQQVAAGAAGLLTAGLLAEIDAARRDLVVTLSRGKLPRDQVERWEETVADHAASYATRAPVPLLGEIMLDIADVRDLLDGCRSPGQQRALARTLGRLSGIAAVLIDDLGSAREARAWMRLARTAASEAGDREYEAWTYARESFFLLHYGGPRDQAVRYTRLARTVAGSLPCAAAVMAPTVEARALAALDAENDALRALNDAADALDLARPDQQRGLFGWSYQQMIFSEGRTLTTLGRTGDAIAAQDQALRGFPAGEFLDPTLVRLDRAQALIRDGDVTEGCRLGTHVLGNLPPEYRSLLITSWADDALAAIPPLRRGATEAIGFKAMRDLTAPAQAPDKPAS